MKRLIVCLAAAVLGLGALAGTASASHSTGADVGAPFDFIDGVTAQGPIATPLGTFNAHQSVNGKGPQGGTGGVPASGTFHTYIPDFGGSYSGDIICLDAVPSGAITDGYWRGMVTSSSLGPVPVNSHIFGRVVDSGEGSNAPPDESAQFVVPPGTLCPPVPVSTLPLDTGNWVVHG